MEQKRLITRQEARQELIRKGISMKAWARQHGLNYDTVRSVLRHDHPCNFGKSHKAAVLLGIKDGEIID